MKIRNQITVAIIILTVLIFIGSCTTGKKIVKFSNKPLYDILVNTEYDKIKDESAKFIFNPGLHAFRKSVKNKEEFLKWKLVGLNELYDKYLKISDANAWVTAKYGLIDKWTDSDNDVIISLNSNQNHYLLLYKITNDISSSNDRDNLLKETISLCIKDKRYDLAIIAAKDISSSSIRDSQLLLIVENTILINDYESAIKAADNISSSSKRNDALKDIFNSLKDFIKENK